MNFDNSEFCEWKLHEIKVIKTADALTQILFISKCRILFNGCVNIVLLNLQVFII